MSVLWTVHSDLCHYIKTNHFYYLCNVHDFDGGQLTRFGVAPLWTIKKK